LASNKSFYLRDAGGSGWIEKRKRDFRSLVSRTKQIKEFKDNAIVTNLTAEIDVYHSHQFAN